MAPVWQRLFSFIYQWYIILVSVPADIGKISISATDTIHFGIMVHLYVDA